MALTFVKRSSIPATVKGKTATKAMVAVGENGQIVLNSLASKHFNGDLHFGMAADGGKVYMFPKGAKALGKTPDSELFEFKKGKKSDALFMSATNFLKSKDVFGEHIYDFKASGNQSFDATIDEKNQALIFELPKGSLTPRPKVARDKKKKKTTSTVAADQPPATSKEVDELILDA